MTMRSTPVCFMAPRATLAVRAFLFLTLLSVAPGCVRGLADAPCPCAVGWTCCAPQNRCVPENAICAGADAQTESDAGSCPAGDASCPGSAAADAGSHGPTVFPNYCDAEGWCGASPDYVGIWGSGDDDIWLLAGGPWVTPGSALLHFDGTEWKVSATDPAAGALAAVWGSGPDDVFAVGLQSTILHFDGTGWTPQAGPQGIDQVNLAAVGGTAPDDVWAVGSQIGHYSGSTWSWTPVPLSKSLSGVWASSRTDAWTVGERGTVLHWDGTQWSLKPIVIGGAVVAADLNGVWGSSATDVWVVGSGGGTVLHFDGTAWSSPGFASLTVSELLAVVGTGPNDVWAVGPNGTLLHWDGMRWTFKLSGAQQTLNAIWRSPSGDIWGAGSDSGLVHWNGDDWQASSPNRFEVTGDTPLVVRGSGPNDVWLGGQEVSHWNGESWTACPLGLASVEKIWVAAPNHALMVGPGGLAEYQWSNDGCALSRPGTAQALHGIWGSGPDDIWTGGELGIAQHWDGTSWTDVSVPTTESISSIWGSAADDVWAVFGTDEAIHWDGSNWSLVSPLTGLMVGPGVGWSTVTGTAANDRWVFSNLLLPQPGLPYSVIVSAHWDGSTWTAPTNQPQGLVTDAWQVAPGQLWIMPGLAQWDGTSWVSPPTGEIYGLESVWGESPDDVWAVGYGGLMLHRQVAP